jgi:hypothetical protein
MDGITRRASFERSIRSLPAPPVSHHRRPLTAHGIAASSGLFRQCHDHEARTHLGPPAISPTDGPLTATGSLPAPATAATCHPDVQTHLGLPPFSSADGFRAHCPQPVHHQGATNHCHHHCHCCRFRQIRGPFPDKTHLSRHDKQAY